MKLNKLLIVTILSAFVFIIGCKTETAKDLLVRKWKFTEITGPDAAKIPDEIVIDVTGFDWFVWRTFFFFIKHQQF